MVEHGRVQSQNHYFTYNEPMPVISLTQSVSNLAANFGGGAGPHTAGTCLDNSGTGWHLTRSAESWGGDLDVAPVVLRSQPPTCPLHQPWCLVSAFPSISNATYPRASWVFVWHCILSLLNRLADVSGVH
jgi:hypothetical protein